MKIQRCKGTRDLSSAEMQAFRFIEGVFRDCCLGRGFEEIRTPTIEYLNLFTSAGTLTPGMLSKVYSFLDWDGWSGERVVLRPDGTIPVARLYTERLAERGFARLFYVTNIFIFDETGKKNRERWQGGVELIGKGSPLVDTELISLALEVLGKLGLEDLELRLSHAGLLKALLAGLGLGPDEQTRLLDLILDGDAAALDGLKAESRELGGALLPLLNLKGQSPGFLKNLKALAADNFPEIGPHLDDFMKTVSFLEAVGCNYQIDLASGAGFEYYTGVVFQFFRGGEQIGGGGRYDDLVRSMGGDDVPASGFALYLDRLMALVRPEAVVPAAAGKVFIRVQSGEAEVIREAYSVADCLRQQGYTAEIDLGGREPADLRWYLDVGGKDALFTVQDKLTRRFFPAENAGEVIALLEEKGADKDSLA